MGSRRRQRPDGWLTLSSIASSISLHAGRLPGDQGAPSLVEPESTPLPVALYIHFPFCLSVCPYCDFVVYAGRAARGPDNRIASLVDALVTEISMRGRAASIGSVYLGGGTPSLMSAAQAARLLDAAATAFGIADGPEVTLEVNPGAADRGDLAGFVAAGVNRISIGAQSMDEQELRRLGRRHSAADVAATVAEARQAGIGNVSIDLLYDVPGQTLSSLRASLNVTLALEPDHVSAYALTLDGADLGDDHLPSSPGATRWRSRARSAQDEDRAADMYELIDDLLSVAGLRWYEISNWSRVGRESRHNLAYWTGKAWEAVGPGAHAFDGVSTRRWNAPRLDGYVAALAANRLPPGAEQRSDPNASSAERAILSLRTSSGLAAAMAESGQFRSAIAWGVANDLLATAADGVVLTRRGRLLSNEVFARLIP